MPRRPKVRFGGEPGVAGRCSGPGRRRMLETAGRGCQVLASCSLRLRSESPVSSLSPNDWRHLEPLIDAVLDTPREHRAAMLTELSGGDEWRRAQLARLVDECEADPELLRQPVAERFASLFDESPVPDIVADRYLSLIHI